jgi:peptidoglycan/xylan/chitin deacetylase (PgdA/CDA1 family)
MRQIRGRRRTVAATDPAELPAGARRACLTLDAGADGLGDAALAATAMLEEHDVCATVFLPGSLVRARPELAQDLAGHGHELGLAGWTARRQDRLDPASLYVDLVRGVAAVADATGARPRWRREAPLVCGTLGLTLAPRSGGGLRDRAVLRVRADDHAALASLLAEAAAWDLPLVTLADAVAGAPVTAR